MRNINELIGIIKGISFDNVINEKEVDLLRVWINKNKNLAYRQEETQLIEVVESFINADDCSVFDIENKLLNLSIKEFVDNGKDGSNKTYELNGIILGILCDDELSNNEIYGLKKWIDRNKNLIQEQKQYKVLCDEIDEMLKDDKAAEGEQLKLLNIMYLKAINSQFESKLDYLCKLVDEKKNIGIDLIDILDDESAKTEIHRRAEQQINEALRSYSGSCSNYEIIVISLVLIAMLEYDGNYYDSVRNTYKNVYDKFSEQRVEGFIRDVLNRYKKTNEAGGRKRIINVALENAIVPQTFLSAFFDLIFDIYKRNFDCYMPEDPYEEFKFVFEGLKNHMSSSDENILINATQKTYKLTVATKQLIQKDDGIDEVVKLSVLVANLIDKRYWGDDVKVSNSYLKNGYEGWEATLKDNDKVTREHMTSINRFKSRWEPKIIIERDKIYLVPPFHKIKSEYNYRNLKIVISNGDETICVDSQPYVEEIIGGYQIRPRRIEIDNPLGQLVYKLMCGSETIYDSKNKLYRKFIAFDLEGHEISNNTDFDGTVQICYKNNEANFERRLIKEHYNIGYKNIQIGDAINIGNDILIFSSITKPGIFGQLHGNCFVCDKNNGKYLQVFKKVKFIAFESKDKTSKYEVVLNDKIYKLTDMTYRIDTLETRIRYIVDLGLNESGIYHIQVNQLLAGKKIKVLNDEFVYDRNLDFFSKKISKSRYKINVSSGLFENDIDTEISLDDFDVNFITFSYKKDNYNLILPFDFGWYCLDGGEWNSAEEDLWIGEIKQDTVMKIYDSKSNGMLLYTDTGKLVEDNIAIRDKGIYKEVSIGFVNSYKNTNKYVMLVLTADEKVRYAFFCYNKSIINEEKTNIICLDNKNDKRFAITPIYHGKNDVYFKVFGRTGKELYKSEFQKSGETKYLKGLKSFYEYTFEFYEKPKIKLFGKDELIYKTSCKFYAKCDLVGKIFKIDTAFYNEFNKNEYVEKECRFNKVYLNIDKRIEKDLYSGEIFIETANDRWWLDGINPIEIELCSEIDNGKVDVYISNNGDGLLLDTKRHRLLNTMDDALAPDAYLFSISIREG